MSAILNVLCALHADRRGATAIEYALIAALIVIAMIAGMSSLGGGIGGMWSNISADFASA